MTPKEKADELFNKMDIIIYTDQDNCKSQCINYALVLVDEIMQHLAFYDYTKKFEFEETSSFGDSCFITYWEEVKAELEKL